jgi:hypothetical protein
LSILSAVVLANLQANSTIFSNLAKNAPVNSLAAVLLGSTGLPGYSDVFPGYQWVFAVIFSGKAINGLKIGLSDTSSAFASNLMQQVLFTFPGESLEVLTKISASLSGNDVYAFLAPTSLIDSGTLYATANGASPLTMKLDQGLAALGSPTIGYLQAVATPEPAALPLALIVLGGLAVGMRRRNNQRPGRGRCRLPQFAAAAATGIMHSPSAEARIRSKRANQSQVANAVAPPVHAGG